MRNRALSYLAAVIGMSVAGSCPAADLKGNDLSDCEVLLGGKKRTEYKKLVDKLSHAAGNGDVKSGLDLAGILNNRFVCLEEELSGDESWTIIQESAARTETKHRPTVINIKEHAAAYSALRDVVIAYERVAESSLRARASLGRFYARYHDALKKNEEGYVYIASAYEAECGKPPVTELAKSPCVVLKQDKMLYLPLTSTEQRSRLDQKAQAWMAQYKINQGAKPLAPACKLEDTPLELESACPTFKEADNTLNRTYKALISTLDKDAGALLRSAQRTWIKWRDEKCVRVQEASGCNHNGSCNGVAHDDCIVDLTNQRNRELENFSQDVSAAKGKAFAFSRNYD